jgi:hypothetical protein
VDACCVIWPSGKDAMRISTSIRGNSDSHGAGVLNQKLHLVDYQTESLQLRCTLLRAFRKERSKCLKTAVYR